MVDISVAGPRWLFPECDRLMEGAAAVMEGAAAVVEGAAAVVEVEWGWSDVENVVAGPADAEVVGRVTTWQPC